MNWWFGKVLPSLLLRFLEPPTSHSQSLSQAFNPESYFLPFLQALISHFCELPLGMYYLKQIKVLNTVSSTCHLLEIRMIPKMVSDWAVLIPPFIFNFATKGYNCCREFSWSFIQNLDPNIGADFRGLLITTWAGLSSSDDLKKLTESFGIIFWMFPITPFPSIPNLTCVFCGQLVHLDQTTNWFDPNSLLGKRDRLSQIQ